MPDQTDRPTFADFITDHAQGVANDEITAALRDVVGQVQALDKKGSVVVKVEIEPAGTGSRTVSTAVKVEAKPPQPDPFKSIFYPDQDGTLFREDPSYAQRTTDPEESL